MSKTAKNSQYKHFWHFLNSLCRILKIEHLTLFGSGIKQKTIFLEEKNCTKFSLANLNAPDRSLNCENFNSMFVFSKKYNTGVLYF